MEFNMNKDDILNYLEQLNNELSEKDVFGHIILTGGAVMCMGLNARSITMDIDAIFEPATEIRKAIKNVSDINGIPKDWLNDGVKRFLSDRIDTVPFKELSNLSINMVSNEYLLAMKLMSARNEGSDKEDIKFLLNHLNIKDKETALKILTKYYDPEQISIKTEYVIEEVLSNGISTNDSKENDGTLTWK